MPYDGCMERVLDKAVILLGCCMALSFRALSMPDVAGMLVAVTASALFEIAPGKARYAGVAAYLALAIIAAPCGLFAPLAAYDCMRPCEENEGGEKPKTRRTVRIASATRVLCAAAVAATAVRTPMPASAVMLVCVGAAALLSWRTSRLLASDSQQRRARDAMRERSLALEARNRDLHALQDYEVRLATLSERGRIAREIHDNVGHLLTRALLQIEALQVVHADDAQITRELAPVNATVSEALGSVRASVHALHDDALDLEDQILACAASCEEAGLRVTVDYSIDEAPTPVALCLIAVTREALSNVMRHSQAAEARVRLAEYPALYQITVFDSGHANIAGESRKEESREGKPEPGMCAPGVCEPGSCDPDHRPEARAAMTGQPKDRPLPCGMGLHSMEERVTALGGTFHAGATERGGWRVFASIPKETIRS